GTGSLTKTGGGTLTLTGDNSFTGTTTIAAGTLQIGNGGTTGSIAGDVTNDGALAFNRSAVLAYGGAITGTGSLSQAGGGVLTMTGDSSYGGNTTVTSSELRLTDG